MSQNPPDQPPFASSQPGPHGSPYPPPAPKKNFFVRHKLLTGVGVLVLLIVVISTATGGGGTSEDSNTAGSAGTATATGSTPNGSAAAEPTSAAAPRPGIGAPARDGKFEFVVRGVRDGGTTIGPDFMAERAQGRFVLVDLTVRNIGNEAQSLDVSSQKVLSTKGTQFSPNTTATISVDDAAVFYEQINPGNALQLTIAYDLPTGVDPAEIELHDSLFSGGVTVALR
ncbi:DUF4352 domain-containing protein [Williamsia sp. MIQD14]|uniref:DUF4352 domain-containing protein n=1 Tax=Williamsia sp. MIQD14 TaxID=3425703 RepID=UPI003DA04148